MSVAQPTSQHIPLDYVKSLLAANGLPDLSDEMVTLISEEAEGALTELFTESSKFMRHSRRKVLSINDINSALKVKKMEPYYGYNPAVPLYYQRLHSNHEMFVRQEQTIDLSESVHSQFFPDIPRDINIGCHWLTVDGVQPQIPQNPSVFVAEKVKKEETIETKPIIRHSLSKELQMYYDMVVEVLNTTQKEKISSCLDSVKSDSGLQQLTPYFIRYISNHVLTNLNTLDILSNMLGLVNALSENQNVNLEPYLHQLFPVILTLVVTKQIGTGAMEDHWEIRTRAAKIVKKLSERYSDKYGRLNARLLQTYLKAITEATKPLTTQYGGIVGITAMGERAVFHLLVPAMKSLKERYEGSDVEQKMCSKALFDAGFLLAKKLKEIMETDKQGELKELNKELVGEEFNVDATFKMLHDIFGDLIIPADITPKNVGDVLI
ncbi:transcription initiation factor tfiid, putative [Entamoeba invadens IP1]|uniref:transcription initiation factor tfiid, putative n=1 Tax=Entamoeba invadens IP1 TaxID=370355 RepID=UPI0002C3F29D|nr:transcription initiation factor tfiid, putative [Entamoeba invadens IP1]ELP94151.1 transcription initiation factor tfiid, putative [Entamoeba invadens IP1]|eukprot:XP_004260922.1 transcription initiation factor tfiid, putative [Entamoeba invadens IP1]